LVLGAKKGHYWQQQTNVACGTIVKVTFKILILYSMPLVIIIIIIIIIILTLGIYVPKGV